MPYINLLIKPASSLCNMRCRYCFYADEAANRELPSMGVMTASTAEMMIARALEAAGFDGGCKRDWVTDADGARQNYFCAAFRQFFAHAAPRLREIAEAEKRAMRREWKTTDVGEASVAFLVWVGGNVSAAAKFLGAVKTAPYKAPVHVVL